MPKIIRSPQIQTKPPLSNVEWDLERIIKCIPEWQWLMMLHYEYARCCAPLLKEVSELREMNFSPEPGRRYLQFSRLLAEHFPEFPKVPWANLAVNEREERLRLLGVNETTGFYPDLIRPAWNTRPPHDPKITSLLEELTFEASRSYGFFKIDYRQPDEIIVRQFSEWLRIHRENHFHSIQPRLLRRPAVGKGHRKHKIKSSIKELGALRALHYWGDWQEAETHTQSNSLHSINTNPLYTEQRSWNRAEFGARIMLRRLLCLWKHSADPINPFEPYPRDDFFSRLIHACPKIEAYNTIEQLSALQKSQQGLFNISVLEVEDRTWGIFTALWTNTSV